MLKYKKSQYSSFNGSFRNQVRPCLMLSNPDSAALPDTQVLRATRHGGFSGADRGGFTCVSFPRCCARNSDCSRAPAGLSPGQSPRGGTSKDHGTWVQDTEMSSHHSTQGQHQYSSHTPCPSSMLLTDGISLLHY